MCFDNWSEAIYQKVYFVISKHILKQMFDEHLTA